MSRGGLSVPTERKITLGLPLLTSNLADLTVAEVAYPRAVEFSWHAHESTYICFVLRGGFQEEVGRETTDARSTAIVIMPAGTAHRERFGPDGARSLVIAFQEPFKRLFPGRSRSFERWNCLKGGIASRFILRAHRAYRLAQGTPDGSWEELLLDVFDLLHYEASAAERVPPRCIAEAAERLREERATSARISDLAREVGKDPAYLARAFRRHYGYTMSEYRRRSQTRRAAHLLASTNVPLSQVALSAGFADQSHLCRVFKVEMGVSPRVYRSFAQRD